jgi:membrane-bound serine protease (ClpP class)
MVGSALTLLAPFTQADWALLAGALVVLGVVLLALEILVIPGFGATGIGGILAIIAGGLVASSKLGILGGVLAFGGGVGASIFLLWLFPRTGLARRLVLSASHRGMRAPEAGLAALVGQSGVADTPLRPAGQATVGNARVDVVTDGIFVEAGTRVRVVNVEGMRVVVEPVEDGM